MNRSLLITSALCSASLLAYASNSTAAIPDPAILSELPAKETDKVSIHAKNRPATEVFADIMRQTGKNFIYQTDLLRGLNVTVNANDASLKSVLAQMFDGTGITFKIQKNNILLSRSKEIVGKQRKYVVSGFVREAETGEALAGATVTCSSTKNGVFTNAMGFYSISIPEGECQLTVSYPGYAPEKLPAFTLSKDRQMDISMRENAQTIKDVVVIGNKNRTVALETAGVGSLNVGKNTILNTPVVFGESDVIKTLQFEPGVSAGIDGMAGMYVHGGNSDENMYMLDNIPLYQVNHLDGLFSAFNTEAIRNVDFHKSSFPAKFDGRLSSYMDVHTKDGSMSEHHGSARLGLTSGAFNIDGPIWKDRTSYSFAIRRSWYDLLTIPIFAIYNAISEDEKTSTNYAFTDINAKINHRFNNRSRGYLMFYYGEDYLRVSQNWDKDKADAYWDEEKSNLRWGNIVASAGWNYMLTPKLFGELTGAYSRYASRLEHSKADGYNEGNIPTNVTSDKMRSDNHIDDWILKADFDWSPHQSHRINFGAGYTLHSFLPSLTTRTLSSNEVNSVVKDRVSTYRASEFNAYFGGDWRPADPLRVDYGLHFSLFHIGGKNHSNLSPRLSLRWQPAKDWAVKAGYSRTVQYVHQLIQSSISLPTDQWVPVTNDQKPQTADKIFAGAYYSFGKGWTVSVEGYWKKMRNLLEYADEYYLLSPETDWTKKLTAGKGSAKGLDFKISKDFGALSGHIAYSLMWADRQYADKNGGKPFPARFDNRHKINVLLNWKINKKWEMSAAWTGMTGNRITLPTQCWQDPALAPWNYDMTLATEVNNYRLPFNHRLDLNFRRYNRRGYWDFSLYNAYCNMSTIGVQRDYSDKFDYNTGQYNFYRVFKKIKLIPVIPSISYTWLF